MSDTALTGGLPDGWFHHLVADVAARRPDAVAATCRGTAVTYGALDEDANRLAQHLLTLGAGPGARVGVCLERSIESLLVQLAVFKTGSAAVLLDPEYPQERLRFMLADSGAVAVATRGSLTARIDDGARPVLLVDAPDAAWRSAEPIDPKADIAAPTVCHIAYTSGSTGVPKAVLLRHGPMRNTGLVLRQECGIDENTQGSWLCSPGFGLVEVDCFPVLAAGGTVHIPDPAVASDPARLRDWLVRERITQSLVLTAMAERLWGLDWPASTPLRIMRIAGERVRSWPPQHLPFHVLNVYGSAEATVVATCDLTELGGRLGVERTAELLPPVGTAVANVRIHVLDQDLEPCPPGVDGELYISGASLSEGYLNRPDANSSKFLPNPVPGDPYPVLYRSGDIARTWEDGTLEIVGRTDDQVKIRGYLVHLGEVESALAALPGVHQCAVLAREDTPGERRLVAYVEPSPAPAAPPSVPALRRAMVERLPGHMVPAVFVVGDLPTSVNGKIDRAKLPAPPRSRPELDVPYREPASDLERRIARVWADVLDLDDLGADDSFFELGGDSLRATRLLATLRTALGLDLSMADLFAEPTVAAVARRSGAADGPALAPLAADPAARHLPFPLTPAQRRQLADGWDHLAWDRDWLDTDQFLDAWDALTDRHDALRTVLVDDSTQQVRPSGPEAVTVTDLGAQTPSCAAANAEALWAEQLAADAPAPGEPLHRLHLVLLPGKAVRIQLAVHRAALDADSLHRLLLPELADLYEDVDTPRARPGASFRDWALPPAAAAELPAAPPATPLPEHRATVLEAWQWTALNAAAEQAGTTAAQAVLTVLAQTVAAHGGLTLRATGAARDAVHPELDRVAGPFAEPAAVDGPALVVTSLLDRPGAAASFGPESRARFGAPGAAAHLLVRVLDGRLRLDWDLPPADLPIGGLPAGSVHRLARACDSGVGLLTASHSPASEDR
ncbi:amino acid adenylation domain-containing protein [Kitasatospora sp. NPDC004531]